MSTNLNPCQPIPPGPNPTPNPNPNGCTGTCCPANNPVSSTPVGATSSGGYSPGGNILYPGAPMANSVMLATGEFIFSLDLLSTPAIGAGSWKFSLQYLSNNGVDDIVGLYWNYSQDYQLSQLPNGDIVLMTPDNLQETFIYNGNGQWMSGYNNTQATLVEINAGTANDTFILTSNAGTVTEFFGFYSSITTPGRMKSTTDRYGNSQSFIWTVTAGVVQLTSVTDAYGRTINYAYYGSTGGYLLSQITDFLGRQLNFQYDSAGHLIAVVLPSINNAAPDNTFPNGTAYVFQYDTGNSDPNRQNDLIKIWYPNETLPYINSSRVVDTASVYTNATPRYVIAYGQTSTDLNYGAVISETVGDPTNGVGGTYTFSYSNTSLPSNIIDPSDPIVSQTTMTDRNGNITVFNFNYNGMVVMKQVQNNRNKSSLETGPYVTWTQYNAQNQKLLEVFPAGDSMAYTYDTGMIDFGSGAQLYPPRRGLLLSETHYPGNSIGIPSRPGSNGQSQLTKTWFYDPIYNQVCAVIEHRGNPISTTGSPPVNVYFTPQNGTAAPTDSDRSAYATFTYYDYQKNQTATITGSTTLQDLLGLTAAQIQSLITYAGGQMTAGGLPNGFQTNLGDINGDGTGGVGPQESAASPMLGNRVKIQQPSATVIGSSSITSQTRIELFTVNARGQATTHTDGEGNVTVYVRYPENDPNGDGTINPAMSSQQYGQLREVHVDADPNEVMSLVGTSGDLTGFNQSSLITRTNTPGVYQDLITRYEGDSPASAGCVTCAYDPLGHPTAVTDPRGFTTVTERNEVGGVYRVISPAPYNFTTELYFDANGNVTRTDTQDQQVQFDSADPTSPDYGQFTPTGSGSTAHAPMTAGPGGTVRPGWFTNLYTYNILGWKTQEDIDATGSNPSSLTTTYSFDPNGNIIKITKPEGNIVEYDYDERNIRIARRVGYTAINPTAAAITIYITDNNGNALAVIGPADRGTVNNSLTATIADAFSDGASLVHTGDWSLMNTILDGFNRVTQAMDAVGGYTAFTYDPGSRPIESDRYGTVGGTTPTDRTGAGNQLLSTQITRFDEAGRRYESQNNVLIAATVTLPSGRTVTHTGGGLAGNSTANDHNQTVTLTTGGQSYVLTRTVYDRADRSVQTIGDNTAVSTTAYDGANRLILTTDALGNTTAIQYDGNSNPTLITRTEYATITAPATATEVFQSATFYDGRNKPIATAMQGADGTFTTDLTQISYSNQGSPPATMFTLTGYDSRGNRTIVIDARGHSSVQTFDGASRPLESRQLLRQNGLGNQGPAANSTFQSAGRGLIRTQTLYDGNSRMFQMIDDRGATTDYTFDTLDRQVTLVYADGSTKTNVYNTTSNIVTYIDENGSVFNNTWDCLGRKTNVAIVPAIGIGGTTSQTFQYDGLNRSTLARDTVGTTNADVTLVYDSIGRTVEEAQVYGGNTRYVTNTAFTSIPATQFEYPDTRLVNNSYDALYRRQEVIEQATSAVIAAWQFFGPDRIAEVTLANGLACTYLNNARTNSAVQSPSPANPAWGDNTTDRLGYDGAGRNITKRYLSSTLNAQNGYADTTALVGNTTAYDRNGNKFYERALHAESRSVVYQPVDNNGNIASPTPGYDSVNRLLQYQRGTLNSTGGYQLAGGGSVTTAIALPNTDAQEAWNLDGLGNWRSLTFTPMDGSPYTQQRNHNYLNQITNFGSLQFTYDGAPGASNGNLTNDIVRAYQFDALNRLIQVNHESATGTLLGNYVFDAFNRRIRKTISNGGLFGGIANGTTDCLYLGSQVLEERDPFGGTGSTDTPIRQYIWGTYIDELIQLTTLTTLGAQNVPAGAYYLLQDLLYRAVALTNSSGGIVEAYDTDAYGQTIIYTGPGPDYIWFTDEDAGSGFTYGANDMIFCGYRYDPETRLYYVRNRMFLTDTDGISVGRWLQRDPIGYAGGINLYEYVGGRAEVEVDPEGLLRCVPCYVCQQTLDQEEAQAIQQIRQEAIGLGFPGDLSWNITASGTLVLISSNLWGGPIGVTVGRILLLGGIIGKLIELGALIQQLDAEIQSDIAAYKNCMKNCTN